MLCWPGSFIWTNTHNITTICRCRMMSVSVYFSDDMSRFVYHSNYICNICTILCSELLYVLWRSNNFWLVVWNIFYFSIQLGIVIPTDSYFSIFFSFWLFFGDFVIFDFFKAIFACHRWHHFGVAGGAAGEAESRRPWKLKRGAAQQRTKMQVLTNSRLCKSM